MNVTVEGDTLTIFRERRIQKQEKNRKFLRIERYYGRFVRRFALFSWQGERGREAVGS